MNTNTRNRICTTHSPNRRWTIHQGDVQSVLPTLGRSLYDGVLTDPPYGLKFMGHGWDKAVPPVTVWQQLLQACKPGAFLLAFGGTKTFHRLMCHIEDAGWEIRDTLCWLFSQGLPKGLNIAKGIDRELGSGRSAVTQKNSHRHSNAGHRWGFADSKDPVEVTILSTLQAEAWKGYSTALKPAWEPIVLAQKPCTGSFARNAMLHGCGGLNIDRCRIGSSGGTERSHQAPYPRRADGKEDRQNWGRSGHSAEQIDKGRWPANLLFDEQAAQALDQQSGHSTSARSCRRRTNPNVGNGRTLKPFQSRQAGPEGYDDEGGASRFFYVAKASPKERQGNSHPTVKPIALCQHLAELILPPERKTPRRLLVPFSGSGSEMLGGLGAGWDHVTGIEAEAEWVSVARKRLLKSDRDARSA
jgi:site-specific DNA-methyltransferase (adenine-specific)